MSKNFDMKSGAVIRARDLAGASVSQQLGLNTPEGVQRLIMILLAKLDPDNQGVFISIPDLNMIIPKLVERPNLVVLGEKDQLFLKLCNTSEYTAIAAHQESLTPGVQ